jgi:hypothetical protein
MVKNRKRKCRCCKELYVPDHRPVKRQRYCGKAECRKASKATSQRRWLRKPENRNYFRGAENVERVRRWRKEHPERTRPSRAKPDPVLQDVMVLQPANTITESAGLGACVLQDLMASQPLVLLGLIARLTDSTLQDEIAKTSLSLLRLGQDVMRRGGGVDGEKATIVPGAGATGAAPV